MLLYNEILIESYVSVSNMKDEKKSEDFKKNKDLLDYANRIIATIRTPFLILDENLRIISANDAFYTIFNVEKKETIGKELFDLGKNSRST